MSHSQQSKALEAPAVPIDVCPACKGVRAVMRPAKGRDDLIYPLGTSTKSIMVLCEYCNDRKPWLRRYCGLEPHERARRLHHWKVPAFKDAERREQRKQARLLMEDAIEARHGFFTFWGDFGSGKTLALQIVVNELRELERRQIEGFYAPFVRVLEHLLSLIRDNRESSSFWQRLLDVPVLAIDEVTRFKATEWAQQKLFDLVDLRYRRRPSHLTVFATNDDPRTVLSPGDALGYLYSRMREGELCELRGDVRGAVRGKM